MYTLDIYKDHLTVADTRSWTRINTILSYIVRKLTTRSITCNWWKVCANKNYTISRYNFLTSFGDVIASPQKVFFKSLLWKISTPMSPRNTFLRVHYKITVHSWMNPLMGFENRVFKQSSILISPPIKDQKKCVIWIR